MTSDSEPLRQYARRGDENAFAEVVRRQADLVYSAALRVAGNSALAQDVTQSVFLKLARRAGRLCQYDTIVGWLHTTTRHAALNAIRGESRRHAREQEAFIMQHDSSTSDASWEQLRPVLDEAVHTLHEQDRKAVLLRFFSGQSHQEVGAVLGLNEEAARKRVDRALEKLRVYFARRGVTVSSALLASAIGANSVQAAPPELAANVAGTSLANAGAVQSVFLQIFLMSAKLKLLAVATLVVVAALLTINWPRVEQSAVTANSRPVNSAPATSVASPQAGVTARVARPVSTASASVASITPPLSTPGAGADQFVVAPQTDLRLAISAGLHFLENQDTLSFFKTLMPPDAIAKEGKGLSLEELVEQIHQSPAAEAKLASMLAALDAIQDKTPSLNGEGTRATYTLEPPVGGHKAIIFNKEDGFWYLDGM